MIPDTLAGAFVRLHLSILLAGFTGVLGKLITLSEGMLVWYRMALAICFAGLLLLRRGGLPRLPLRDALPVLGVGVILSLHWVLFYASIKLANVSVGVVCLALMGFFTAIIEPLYARTAPRPRELALGGLAVAGIALIFSLDVRYRLGIAAGVLSSVLAAVYFVRNKSTSAHLDALTALFYQMCGGFAFLSLLMPAYIHFFAIDYLWPVWQDWAWLTFMALFCTVGMCVLLIQSLQRVSAFTANLSYNLEPVYSIAIAMLFLQEGREVGAAFFAGLLCIALSVLLQSWLAWREQRRPGATPAPAAADTARR